MLKSWSPFPQIIAPHASDFQAVQGWCVPRINEGVSLGILRDEKIVLFLSYFQVLTGMQRTSPFFYLRVGLFQFASHAIFHSVKLFVDISRRITPPPKLLCGRFVLRIGRADKIRIRNIKPVSKRFKARCVTVHIYVGLCTGRNRLL